MDRLRKHRKVVRAGFTKGAAELEKLVDMKPMEEENRRQLQACWVMLEGKHNDLTTTNSQIYEALLQDDASEEDLTAEVDTRDTYERRFNVLKVQYDKIMSDFDEYEINESVAASVVTASSQRSSSRNTGVVETPGRRKFKLPTIEFKKFDGNVRDWLTFWAQFKKIDEDPDIDPEDKIEYLRQATVPGSRARRLVESFPGMGENYKKIVSGLKSRFGREDLQIEVYVRELLKLIMGNAMSKNKMDLSALYDRIETQVRALETLGITTDKFAAMLFPLIESCLPPDLLRIWQRAGQVSLESETAVSTEIGLEDRLRGLMNFLRREVEGEQRVALAAEGFGLSNSCGGYVKGNKKNLTEETIPTAIDLMNCPATTVNKCIFCDGSHSSESCFKAQDFPMERKKEILTQKRACFKCLRIGHLSRKCHERLKCIICGKPHVAMMCFESSAHRKVGKVREKPSSGTADATVATVEQSLTNGSKASGRVFLETLLVQVNGPRGSRRVRALIDTGSQRSYILRETACEMGYKEKRKENVRHCLFGGREDELDHNCFDIRLSHKGYACTFEALDQPLICRDISHVYPGPWMEELQKLSVCVEDVQSAAPIEVLIGADVCGKLYTGRRHILQCGLVAAETLLGWTLSGKIPTDRQAPNTTMTSISLLINDACVYNLWRLDALGITDPSEKISEEDKATSTKERFLRTLDLDQEGRYEVGLLWMEAHPPLPDNRHLAERRLDSVIKRMKLDGTFEAYQDVLDEWLREQIIEEVPSSEIHNSSHYLPHRPVIKESSSTTKIRPVFDASAHVKNQPSLNDCLEKGPNLIETVPSILARFRFQKIGVISDIRKAFLQIGVRAVERDYLRFLWTDKNGTQHTYRHRRVVFGVNCSPYLLGMTIQHHLNKMLTKEECDGYSKNTIQQLGNSFYVDNCVTSVCDEQTLEQFIREAVLVMDVAKFDLRGWECSQPSGCTNSSMPVLGLKWNSGKDTLTVSDEALKETKNLMNGNITKRLILSVAQRVYDPIGFTCPSTLVPKLLLQELWKKGLSWDEPIDQETARVFEQWIRELPHLFEVEIPRWVHGGPEDSRQYSLHTFCDASQQAYSAVVFLRVVQENEVFVHLMAAKARVAPLKKTTIPRLELLGATIAARLAKSVQDSLECEIECYYWSDSSTVISWIRRKEEWTVFVRNRVAEIRALTSTHAWRHIPGVLNPADLPSRGCSAKLLLQSRWWEGPRWLHEPMSGWPQEDLDCVEEEVCQERRKIPVTSMLNRCDSNELHLTHFTKYNRDLRMMAWILRFIHNIKNRTQKRFGQLSVEEIELAEIVVLRTVQQEAFSGKEDKRITHLNPVYDKHGLIRLRSRVSNRDDEEDFRFPIVLPDKHPVVCQLIREVHEKTCHVGTQGLLGKLRERFWILGGRRAIRSVIKKCVTCRRHSVKPFDVQSPPLPLDRVRDAVPFEVTGVDFAGPMYLKNKDKAWICLFTCAVYRAVHLELTTSLSTASFIQALRRFIARRGRPKTIYSDNGTNFVGAENAFSRLHWDKIVEETSTQRIVWRFNPPSAPWWGGFWERLIGTLKSLLRRVLGRASLNYEDLLTLICDCEAVVNSRPITYMSDDTNESVALTPAMFLREQAESGVPDCDDIDKASSCNKMLHIQKLRNDLRKRFRNEYLGQLQLRIRKGQKRQITLGEVVLIGNDQDKRLNWPMGRVAEMLPGKDGVVRLVRIDTAKGKLLRPVQRLYPLECLDTDTSSQDLRESAGVPDQSRVSVEIEDLRESAGVSKQSRVPVKRENLSESAGVSKQSRVPVQTRSGRVSQLPRKFLC